MTTPKVSILLPVYNTKEEYLRETIKSYLNQALSDFELLIYNDGSTDSNVERVVLSYDDQRIRYLRGEKNLGISAARNRLIEEAVGEYLAVADHDDISLPERLTKEAALLDARPEVGAVGTWVKIFPRRTEKVWRPPVENDAIEENMMYGCPIIHPSAMLRRSVLIEHQIRYEERYSPSEDFAFFGALIGKTQFANIPEVLVHYRVHQTNTSRLYRERMIHGLYHGYAQVRWEHPKQWAVVSACHTFHTEVRLFGVVPFLTIRKKMNRTRWTLFGAIPLLELKSKIAE